MKRTTLEIPVNYDGCTSEQERAETRAQAKRTAIRKLAAHDKLLAALGTLVKWLDNSGLSHTKAGGSPPFTYGPVEYQVVTEARTVLKNAKDTP